MDAQTEPYVDVPVHVSSLGRLYQRDCVDFLKAIPDASCDTFFADPPFNLSKD